MRTTTPTWRQRLRVFLAVFGLATGLAGVAGVAAAPPASAHSTCSVSAGFPDREGSSIKASTAYVCAESHAVVRGCVTIEQYTGAWVPVATACREATSTSTSPTATASAPCVSGLYRAVSEGQAWNRDGVLVHTGSVTGNSRTITCESVVGGQGEPTVFAFQGTMSTGPLWSAGAPACPLCLTTVAFSMASTLDIASPGGIGSGNVVVNGSITGLCEAMLGNGQGQFYGHGLPITLVTVGSTMVMVGTDTRDHVVVVAQIRPVSAGTLDAPCLLTPATTWLVVGTGVYVDG